MTVIIRIQVIELCRLDDTVCDSTCFCAFDGIDQALCLATNSEEIDPALGALFIFLDKAPSGGSNLTSWV